MAPATIKYELAALCRGFRLALQAGRLSTVPAFPTIRVSNARTGFFEEAEFRAVLSHLDEDIGPVAEFMYHTGWRKSEVLGLTWDRADLRAGVVRLDTSKSGRPRTLPFGVLPALADLLRRQRERTDAVQPEREVIIPYVFHHRGGQPIHDFRGAWDAACKAAGVKCMPHLFRRTAARNLSRAGVPEQVIMALCGWETRSVFDRYRIVNETDLAEGLSKLARAEDVAPEAAEPRVVAFQAQKAVKSGERRQNGDNQAGWRK